jgi:hypothetical protein
VADYDNNAIRRVTMERAVSTVAGNGEKGFAEGAGPPARFDGPYDVVVDGEDVIVVTDSDNHRLRKIVGGQVTTLAGISELGTTDGAGVGVSFKNPIVLALDERGRLLVVEFVRDDTLAGGGGVTAVTAVDGPGGGDHGDVDVLQYTG